MTNREFYTAVIAETENEELKNFATEAIAKLDARNAKRASTPSKTQRENAPLKESIHKYLEENGAHIAGEIAESLELTVSKVSSLCTQMVKDGVLKSEDVKVKGKGTRKSYSLA